jgi:hypothetical protein
VKFEPQTFFIGVIDLFSILLPGALATALVKRAAEPILFPAIFPYHTGETVGWGVFLFASYLLGHFIFLFGSFLDDLTYQRLRNWAKDAEVALLKEIKKQIDDVNKDGKIVLLIGIANQTQDAMEESKQHQKHLLGKIEEEIPQIRDKLQKEPSCEAEHLAALDKIADEIRKYSSRHDSFFHRRFKWILRQIFSENPDLAVNRVLEIKRGYVPDVKGKAVINAFQWAKAHLGIKYPTALVEVQRLEADSKFFRSLVIVLLFLSSWLFWKTFRGNLNCLIALSCLVFCGLSFWRYVERRFKSTQQAYWFVISLEGETVSDLVKLSKS